MKFKRPLIDYSKLSAKFRIFDQELLYKTLENLIKENVTLDRFEFLNPETNEYLGESLDDEQTFITSIEDVLEYEVFMEELRDLTWNESGKIDKEIKFQWMIKNEKFVDEVFSDVFDYSEYYLNNFARFSHRMNCVQDLSLLEIANEAVEKYFFTLLIDAFNDIFPTIKRQFGIENYCKSQN